MNKYDLKKFIEWNEITRILILNKINIKWKTNTHYWISFLLDNLISPVIKILYGNSLEIHGKKFTAEICHYIQIYDFYLYSLQKHYNVNAA